jgi:polysaccharide biosynthesis/export protein
MGSSIMSPHRRYLALALLGAQLAAATTQTFAQSAANYVIGARDVLAIQVFDQPEIGGKYTVEADGTFSFPLIGRVQAAGRTLRQFEDDLKKKLADGYFRNPQVSVAVDQYKSQQIFVLGEVRLSGAVSLTGGMTLVEAIARAGSTLPTASGEVVVVRAPRKGGGPVSQDQSGAAEIFRASIRDLEAGKLKQNIELQDGDTLYVPRAETAFVFGEVKAPGGYPIQKDMTVLQALSLAGGHTEHAALNRITIVRVVNGETKEIKAKLTDIVKPGDTIKVPQRYF